MAFRSAARPQVSSVLYGRALLIFMAFLLNAEITWVDHLRKISINFSPPKLVLHVVIELKHASFVVPNWLI